MNAKCYVVFWRCDEFACERAGLFQAVVPSVWLSLREDGWCVT